MADGSPGFFFASDPNASLPLRQRLAMALLARNRKYPTTLGEGLGAIGEAIGDIGTERRLLAADKAAQEAALGVPQPPGVPQAQQPASMADTSRTVEAGRVYGPNEPSPLVGDVNAEPSAAKAAETPPQYANVRYNNPGAQYPGPDAAQFGSTGTGVIGGGHPIAQFPTPVHGAAANFSLLNRNYTGMPIGAAISKWSGGGRGTVPGYDPNTVITPAMVQDPDFAVPFMQAVAKGEAPGTYPMSQEQWQTAHDWFKQGGVPGGARAGVAQALTNQQRPPVMAAGDTDFSAQSRTPPQGPPISAAPSQAAPVTTAPMAGYVPPTPTEPQAPAMIPPSPREQQLEAFVKQGAIANPYIAQGPAAQELQQLQQMRAYEQQRQTDAYKEQLQAYRAKQTQQEEMKGTQQARIDAATKAAQERGQFAQYGGLDPKDVYATTVKSKEGALQAKEALIAADDARTAINNGAITGSGANTRLQINKFLYQWGLKPSNDAAVNTEVFKSRLVTLAGSLRRQALSGSTSDTDREYITQASGGDINMEPQALKQLVDAMGRVSRNQIVRHNQDVEQFYSGDAKVKNFMAVDMPHERGEPLAPQAFKSMQEAQKFIDSGTLKPGAVVTVGGKKFRVQ